MCVFVWHIGIWESRVLYILRPYFLQSMVLRHAISQISHVGKQRPETIGAKQQGNVNIVMTEDILD